MKFSLYIKISWYSTLLLSSIYSCNTGCKIIPLSEADKSWLDFASVNDTIAFSSTKNEVDTFVVVKKYLEWGICNRFELGPGQRESGLTVVRKIENGNLKVYNGSYRISFNGGDSHDTVSESRKFMSVLDLETERFYDFDQLIDTTILLPTLNKNVSVLFVRGGNDTRELTGVYPKIDEFYWNKNLGLVAYKKESGEMFYYSKKW